MGLFGKRKSELPPLISDEELFPRVNYESVMNWLVGLSAEDYAKVCKVAEIQRMAKAQSAGVLNKTNVPTSQIDDPRDRVQTLEPFIIDKEPHSFLDDEPKKPKAKKK